MAGRLLLVFRLVVRDLLRHRTETALLLVALTAATGTLTVGLALNGIATRPFEQTRAATAGPDVVVKPLENSPAALAALAPLATAPGVTAHSGPFRLAFLMLTARGRSVHVVVEGRDEAPAPVDQPAVTDGTWVRPGVVVVVERSFADALGVHTGDTVSVNGHPLRMLGTAVTAAWSAFPHVGWHHPGSILSSAGGLVWVAQSDIGTIAGDQPLSYT